MSMRGNRTGVIKGTVCLPDDLGSIDWEDEPRGVKHRREVARHRRLMRIGWSKVRARQAQEKAKLLAELDRIGRRFAKEQKSLDKLRVKLAAREVLGTFSLQTMREVMWLNNDHLENERLANKMAERDLKRLKGKST